MDEATIDTERAARQAASADGFLSLHDVRMVYPGGDGRTVPVLAPISFEVGRGEFVAIVGPSGTGKTTLLKIIAGLVEPTGGTVRLDGRLVTGPPPEMVYLSQQYGKSLLPWRTVLKNVDSHADRHCQPGRQVHVAQRARLPLRHPGAGAPAADAARARPRRRPRHRGFHLRLPRLAAGRLRPRPVACRRTAARAEYPLPERAQRGPRRHLGVGHASAAPVSGRQGRRRVRHLVRQGGPGVDRSTDVFKHGNCAGSARHGGVLLVAGDDHGCQSSALPHQSEQVFAAAMVPALNPATVQDYLDFGLHGIALSRCSGCWIGFKAIAETKARSHR